MVRAPPGARTGVVMTFGCGQINHHVGFARCCAIILWLIYLTVAGGHADMLINMYMRQEVAPKPSKHTIPTNEKHAMRNNGWIRRLTRLVKQLPWVDLLTRFKNHRI
ncbi:hypothetical protein LXL04_011578 [Taraxacum kok-saghyz]